MPPARRTGRQTQQPRPAWVSAAIAALGVAAGAVALWFGYPGAVLAWGVLVAAAWTAPPAMLTGKKDASGFPTAAHPGEAKAMRRFRFWADLKWRLLFPTSAFVPGWPVYGSWLWGVWAAVAVWCVPHEGQQYLGSIPRHLDALTVFVVVTQVCAARRRTIVTGDVSPGVRVDAVKSLRSASKTNVALGALCSLVGASLGAMMLPWAFSAPPLPMAGAHAWVVLGAFGGLGAGVGYWWQKTSLTPWRDLLVAREEWAPRWQMLKHDPAPMLIARDLVGNATVDTFMAPGSMGAMAYWVLGPKMAGPIGAGQRFAVLSTPNTDSQGQPQPGTRHPLRFQVVSWPSDAMPDVTSASTDPDEVRLIIQCAMIWAADMTQYARPILDEIEPLALCTPPAPHHPDDQGSAAVSEDPADAAGVAEAPDPVPAGPERSERQAWRATWLLPDGPPVKHLRTVLGPEMGAHLDCETITDHRHNGGQGAIYIGHLTDGSTIFDPSTGVTVQSLTALATEDVWNARWAEVLKQDVNPPTIEHNTYAEARLANGKTVYRQAFVTLRGVAPSDFFGQEAKIKATLDAAPYVAVTGWGSRGLRPGERHTQAFTVYWSNDVVPANPDSLAPTGAPTETAAQWVLSGRMNEAFRAARLAVPEVYDVKCLTHARSNGHIWRIALRTSHDNSSVTLADVRGASQRIRQALGSEWLRVEAAKDGCVLVMGINPARARLANPERDRRYLTSLDWEQAWLDSKVSGSGGLTPTLVEVGSLPSNEQVQVLDFDLPTGLSFSDLLAATSKLETATGNAFIDVRRDPDGKATRVRVLASEVNPLPERVAFDFDVVDEVSAIPFATGIEGEPVLFDPTESPHALLAGVTGAGKSVLAQNFLYGFLVRGALVYVIDPVKGGADFQFAKPYSVAFAEDPFQAAGVMKAVYAEVVRRKNLNSKHGKSSYLELPDPPPPIVVLIDEFTSLMSQSQVPKSTGDPEMERERELLIAENFARTEVGMLAGKLAREARSAGVTLLLGTQKLTAKMLDTIPGGNDLKTNLARVLLGAASFGDRASALRAFDSAPVLGGAIPKGRGLWESLTAAAVIMQTWYAPQDDLADQLARRISPFPTEQTLDMTGFTPPEPEVDGMRLDDAPLPRAALPAPAEPVITDLGEIAFSLDDLLGDEPEADVPDAASGSADASLETDPDADMVDIDEHIVWDEIDPTPWLPTESQHGWSEIDALLGFVDEYAETRTVDWADPNLDQPSANGETFRVVVGRLLADRGVTLRDGDSTDSDDPADVASAPDRVVGLGADADGFDWDAVGTGPDPSVVEPDEDLTWPIDEPIDESSAPPVADEHATTDPALLDWDSIDSDEWVPAASEYGWTEIDALVACLQHAPEVHVVTWRDPRLDEVDAMGVTYRALVIDLLADRGVALEPRLASVAMAPAGATAIPVVTPASRAIAQIAAATPGIAVATDDEFTALPSVPAHLLPSDDPFA